MHTSPSLDAATPAACASSSRRRAVVICVPLLAVLAACNNPIWVHPQDLGEGIYATPAHYDGGEAEAWASVAFDGTWGYTLEVLALVTTEDRVGPADRWCGSPSSGIVPCAVDPEYVGTDVADVWTVNGDPAYGGTTQLMTVWPGEVVRVGLWCQNVFTGEVGCPAGALMELQVSGADGNPTGQLTELEYLEAVGGSSLTAVVPG
jgi:hypothetical protein